MKGWIAKKNGEYFVEYFPNETNQTELFPLCEDDVKLVEKTYPVLPKWSGKFEVVDGIAHMLQAQRYPIPEYDPYTGEKNPYFDGPRNIYPKKDLDI
jgi:hypothetical protein